VKRLLVFAAAIICVGAVGTAFRDAFFRAIGHALVIDEPLTRSDTLLVPTWTSSAGALEAADLIQQGMASNVAVWFDTQTEATKELRRRGIPYEIPIVAVLKSLNVPGLNVVTTDGNGTTFETQVLPLWCAQNHFRSVIIVSTPEHSRRLRRLLNRSMRASPTKTIVRVTRYSDFDPDRWWKSRTGARDELMELQKLLLDVALHPFS
jgi:hypothetical protein